MDAAKGNATYQNAAKRNDTCKDVMHCSVFFMEYDCYHIMNTFIKWSCKLFGKNGRCNSILGNVNACALGGGDTCINY